MKKENKLKGWLFAGCMLGLGVFFMNSAMFSSKQKPSDLTSGVVVAGNDSVKNFLAVGSQKVKMMPSNDRELFDYVIAAIKSEYVDAEKIGDTKLYESAMNGVLSSLDPHSSYLNEKELKDMKVQTEGEFGGLGIVVTKDSNFVKVVSPIEDTPAYKAGMKAGDYISEIDDKLTYNMKLDEAVGLMRGKPGTRVKLTVLRKGENEPLKLDLKREMIKVDSVKGRIENNDIIYIKITSFTKNTQRDTIAMFNKLRDSLKGKKSRGFILDLRNNPGGLLEQSVKIGELFLEKGSTVVSVKGRDDKLLDIHKSNADKVLIDIAPMVVLVNEGSASASEIVAGALQDHKKAIVMGTKTFGKASVQTVFPLTNGGAIKMTIARYYTPNDRSIQADGIEPDIAVEEGVVQFDSDRKKYREKDLEGHLEKTKGSGDKEKEKGDDIVDKSIKENRENSGKTEVGKIEDYQLSKAIDLIIGIGFYEKR
ncbi:peptidase S41 [Bacilli bacterium]|nr:peptidase S41 [Bacilli bacterium]